MKTFSLDASVRAILIFVILASEVILAMNYESKGKESLSKTVTLLGHLESLLKREKPKLALLKLINNTMTKKILSTIELAQPIPELGKCYDWRHFVFKEDYFELIRCSSDYLQAANAYKSLFKIKDLLDQKFGRDAGSAYWEYWFPLKEVMYVKLSGMKLFNEIDTIQIDVDLDAICDIVMPGQVFPGIKLCNFNIVNPEPFPVFVISIYYSNNQPTDVKKTLVLECMLLQATICPCQRWLDWNPPRYSYHLISKFCDYIQNDAYLDQNFLNMLSLRLTAEQDLKHLALNYGINLPRIDGDSVYYKSGVQILRDLWPGSTFTVSILQNLIVKESSVVFFLNILPDKDCLKWKKLFYNPRTGISFTRTKGDGFNIFRSPNSRVRFSHIDVYFPLKTYIEARSRYSELCLSNVNTNQAFKQIPSNLNNTEQMFNSLHWERNTSQEPVETIKTLIIMYKLMNFNGGITGSLNEMSFNQSKLMLFFHFYQNASLRQQTILYDVIKQECLHFGKLNLDGNDIEEIIQNPECKIIWQTSLMPFNCGFAISEDRIFMVLIAKGLEEPYPLSGKVTSTSMFFFEANQRSEKSLTLPLIINFS